MALLIVPRGPVIGLEANTLQPTKSLNQVQSPCQVSQQEHVKGLLLTFDQIHLKSLPWDSENHHLKICLECLIPGNQYQVHVLIIEIITDAFRKLSSRRIQNRTLLWAMVTQGNPFSLASSARISAFRVEALPYASVQVQNPTGGRHLVNAFLPGQVNKTDLFTELAQQSSNKQAVYHLEDPSLLCFPSYPW